MIYLIPILITALLKMWMIIFATVPFNADEAIVALMARHINLGQIPIFFYGQSYLGSLDAILVAVGFRLFGENILVIRILQSLLYGGTVITTVLLAKRILGSSQTALVAGLLLSVPPVNVTLYTTVSLGGYGELLLIGNLLLLGGLPLIEKVRDKSIIIDIPFYLGVFLWSLGAGFAFWVFGLSLVYSLPIAGILFWNILKSTPGSLWKTSIVVFLGGVLGSIPWWFDAVIYGNYQILPELAGSAIASSNQGSWLLQSFLRLLNLVVFGGSVVLGFRPPWSVTWLAMPLLPLVLIFWAVVFLFSLRMLKDQSKSRSLIPIAAIGIVLSVGFIISPYGADPSGRYFLPLIIPMAIFGAATLSELLKNRPFLKFGILSIVLIYNLIGTVQSEQLSPAGITTQFDIETQIDHNHLEELIIFLSQNDLTRGYTTYWVSYPLAFLSQEDLIFIPRLPYHDDLRYTSRDDRYLPYTFLVNNSMEPAYITARNLTLDAYLREQFLKKGLLWSEKEIGDYKVFYDFSTPVSVDEIGLGQTTSP